MKVVKIGKNRYRRYRMTDFLNEHFTETFLAVGCIFLVCANICMLAKIILKIAEVA